MASLFIHARRSLEPVWLVCLFMLDALEPVWLVCLFMLDAPLSLYG